MEYPNNIVQRVSRWYESTPSADNTSALWKHKRLDFQRGGGLRGYGLNTTAHSGTIRRFIFFFRVGRVIVAPFHILYQLSKKIRDKYTSLCSALILKDRNAAKMYQLEYAFNSKYPAQLISNFEAELTPHKVYFSHNTLKLYSYLLTFMPEYEKQISPRNEPRFLEIGAGLFNFGHLISLRVPSFSYVVIDLPEMIVSAVSQINASYGANYEVFLPNEVDAFHNSTSKRKVIFLTPDQFDDFDYEIDVFINHESFGEMDTNTVNSYLGVVRRKITEGGLIFLVNRHSRLQAQKYDELAEIKSENQITCFDDYELSFARTLVRVIEPFRQCLPKQNERPNVFYIGIAN